MSQVVNQADRVVLTPDTDVVASNAQQLRTSLFDLIQSGHSRIVIDLQQVAMLDSAGLGVFIATHNSLKTAGGELRVINVSPHILRLFQLTRLDRHFAVEAR